MSVCDKASVNIAAQYVYTSTKKSVRPFCMGVATVALVVGMISLLQTAVIQTPIIFMKMSEDSTGEFDMLFVTDPTLVPVGSTDITSYLMNATYLMQYARRIPEVVGVAPRYVCTYDDIHGRWTFLSNIANKYYPTMNTSVQLVAFHTDLERDMGLGRGWDRRALGEYECYVTEGALNRIKVTPDAGDKLMLKLSLGDVLGGMGMNTTDMFDAILGGAITPGGGEQNITVNITALLTTLFPGIDPALLVGNVTEANISTSLFALTPDQASTLSSTVMNAILNASLEFTVADSVDVPDGKWPANLGNVMVIEARYLPLYAQDILNNALSTGVLGQAIFDTLGITMNVTQVDLRGTDVNQYAMMAIINKNDRVETYTKDEKGLAADMIDFSNAVMEAIGHRFPATVTLPLAIQLGSTYFLRLFLDQIFNVVVVILLMLGAIVIYSLMLSDVEEKTYEYGMLRALGMTQNTLIDVIFSQAFAFSIPGVLIGLLVSALAYIPIAELIADMAILEPKYGLESTAVITAVIMGITMPLVSNIVPIRRAMSKTLRDALDLYHQVFSETSITIIRLENLGLSSTMTTLSAMMSICGFVVYYMVPYAFTFGDLPLFFGILMFILIGMVIGLVLISLALESGMEKLISPLLLWGRDRRLASLLVKNLDGHRPRNRKTALMFTMSLAFIVFAGSMVTLQYNNVVNTFSMIAGSDVVALATNINRPLPVAALREYLSLEKSGQYTYKDVPDVINPWDDDVLRDTTHGGDGGRGGSLIKDFAFMSFRLRDSRDIVDRTSWQHVAGYPQYRVTVTAVDKSLLNAAYDQFVINTEIDESLDYDTLESGEKDVIKSLYDDVRPYVSKSPNSVGSPKYWDGMPTAIEIWNLNPEGPEPVLDNSTSNNVWTTAPDPYEASIDAIGMEGIRLPMSVDINTVLNLRVSSMAPWNRWYDMSSENLVFLRAISSKMPCFFFTSYRFGAYFSTIIVSMDQVNQLYRQAWKQTNSGAEPPANVTVPIARLIVKMSSDSDNNDKELVKNTISNFINDDSVTLIDTKELLESIKSSLDLILVFFNVVSLVAVLLCFFVLWVSIAATIRENSWEMAVIRSLGLGAFVVQRLYIYEALCVVLSSVILGTIIGLLVSVTLILQFNLFTEMPFAFIFPSFLYFSTVGFSLIMATVGAYIPSRMASRKEIAHTMKGL